MSDGLQNAQDRGAFVPWREFLTSTHGASLALVSLAVCLHAADSLVVATMLPSIVDGIGGAALVGWTVSLYQIGSIVAGAASALLTLRLGLRRPMSGAAALFGLGCLVSAVSPNMPVVLVGRSLQGLGGGCLVAMCFIAVDALFPRRYMARALAAVSSVWGVSAFLGPLLGGLFVEYSSWRWGFAAFALVAFALAAWIALRRDLRDHAPASEGSGDGRGEERRDAPGDERGDPPGRDARRGKAPGFPLPRLALLCLAVLLISLGGVDVGPGRTAAFGGLGLLCLAGFLWLDGRALRARLLPPRPLDPRTAYGAALLMILSLTIAAVAFTAFGPLLVTAIHGSSALETGYLIACVSFGWSVMAVLLSGSPERLDRVKIATGACMVTLGIAGFIYAVPHGPLWLIAVFAAIEGAGFGTAWTFLLRQATAHAPEGEARRIAAAIPTVQRLGYALGAAYIGTVANAVGFLSMQSPAEAARVAIWVFVACLPFAALGLGAMAALVARRPVE